MYYNSIEFFNPGGLADNLTIDQLLREDYSPWARNKRISATFKEAHFIEKYGSGIKRIQEGFASYGLRPPVFENFQHGFRVIVSSKLLFESNEGVSEGVNLLFNQIRTKPGKRAPFLVNELLVPVKIVERWLKILRDDHKIEFRGAPKSGGYWLK